jgi:hypothetical protein
MRVDPASAIEIIDPLLVLVQGGMGVSAKDARRFVMTRVGQRTLGNLGGKTQPAGIQPVEEAGHDLALRIPFLQLQVDQRAEQVVEAHVVHYEAVELMTVHGDVPQPLVIPTIFLKNANTDQVRHDLGQTVIVVAFDPHHFDVALRV